MDNIGLVGRMVLYPIYDVIENGKKRKLGVIGVVVEEEYDKDIHDYVITVNFMNFRKYRRYGIKRHLRLYVNEIYLID